MKKLALALALVSSLAFAFLSFESCARRATAESAPPPRPAALSTAAPRIAAEGRVGTYPGAEVVVGTDFAGTIRKLAVLEKAQVKKGDLVAELDADAEKAALVEARAKIAEATADIKLAALEVERAQKLLLGKAGTKQALDKAERDRDAAVARKATAAAEALRLAAIVAKARILSPIAGVVLARHAQPGETVAHGARLVTIADLSKLRVEAEVDESDSTHVALGAPVTIRAEGVTGVSWKGHVEEIPDAVTARQLKPQDPGKPTDMRVLLVKVALDEPTPLKLGRRVELEIGTR